MNEPQYINCTLPLFEKHLTWARYEPCRGVWKTLTLTTTPSPLGWEKTEASDRIPLMSGVSEQWPLQFRYSQVSFLICNNGQSLSNNIIYKFYFMNFFNSGKTHR